MKNRKIDLHIHSIASDGSWDVEKIVEIASEKGVSIISITDHDEVKSTKKGIECCKKSGIGFLKGAEISSTYKGEDFHILGYGMDIENEELQSILSYNRYLLEKKDNDFIKILIKKGYNIKYEHYEKYEHKSERGGWKALSFLIDAGLCKDIKDFFTNIWTVENEAKYPEFPSPDKIANVIKNAGGVPILAHPYYSPCDIAVNERLGQFIDMGFEGVECFHPNHTKEVSIKCADFCKKNNLIITTGSDCHGDFIITRSIGVPEVREEDVNLGRLKKFIVY